ncbi:MAG: hypothetical protein ACFFAL_00775 [Promethearchaeota archaeon]
MGNDSTSNALYAIGAIGSLIIAITFAYTLAIILISLPYVAIFEWVLILAVIFVAISMIAIYRDVGSKIPLVPLIVLIVLEILATLMIFGLLFPILTTFLDYATADLLINWLFWILYLIAYVLMGYSIWMTRDQIGVMASISGVLFMIWGVVNLVLNYMTFGFPPSLLDQIWLAGITIVYLVAFIYFIKAIRS